MGLGQKLLFATRRNKTNQIRIRKRELDASNNRSFASEIVSSDYEVTALVYIYIGYFLNNFSFDNKAEKSTQFLSTSTTPSGADMRTYRGCKLHLNFLKRFLNLFPKTDLFP